MKLINNRYQQHMDFDECPSWFLVVENSHEYLKVVEELRSECAEGEESEFVFSDNSNILSMSKTCLLLYNYFDLDINNKKIVNEINSRVLDFVSKNDFVQDFCEVNKILININDKILENFDLDIEYDDDFSYDKFIKLSSYKISEQSKFVDKVMSYIKLYTKLKNTKLVVFIGLSMYLSKEEIQLFIKELNYLELKCLFVEPYQKYKIENSKIIIIDEDLCEI